MSKKITIKDLCTEDKKKIGDLLKKLSNETEEKEKLRQMLQEDKKLYESKIKSLEESFSAKPQAELKSESFAQSFIADNCNSSNITATVQFQSPATTKEIKQLRNKFDSVYSTLKKAARANDAIISKINNDSSSLVEEAPNHIKPIPIKQDDIFDEGFDGGRSFISTKANEELVFGLGGENGSNSARRNNSNFSIATGSTGRKLKYKDFLSRAREKSQEKFNNEINNHLSYENSSNINLKSNNFGNFGISSSNMNIYVPQKNPLEMSISNEHQIQFNASNNLNNFGNNFSESKHNLQGMNNLNISSCSGNNVNNFTIMNTNANTNNPSSINDNEYLNVMNYLNSNRNTVDSISKLNISNQYCDNIINTSSTSTSKLEEVVNDNVFKYIFNLENQGQQKEVQEERARVKEKEFSSALNEVEKDIDNLNTMDFLSQKPEKELTDIPIKASKPKRVNYTQSQSKKDKLKMYEDFQKINSKYI